MGKKKEGYIRDNGSSGIFPSRMRHASVIRNKARGKRRPINEYKASDFFLLPASLLSGILDMTEVSIKFFMENGKIPRPFKGTYPEGSYTLDQLIALSVIKANSLRDGKIDWKLFSELMEKLYPRDGGRKNVCKRNPFARMYAEGLKDDF